MAKQLLTRHTHTEHIWEEKLFGKSYSHHSHPTQVLPSDGAGGISTHGQWGTAPRVSRDGGNPKSLLPRQQQGSVQPATPVQTWRGVIWEAFNVGMPARSLQRKAKLSRALPAMTSSKGPPTTPNQQELFLLTGSRKGIREVGLQ